MLKDFVVVVGVSSFQTARHHRTMTFRQASEGRTDFVPDVDAKQAAGRPVREPETRHANSL
jgi:hypothetical protein